MKKAFAGILKEVITVTIGILIALFINNWNEQRKDEKYIKEIFTSINKELDESKNAIIENIPKQVKFIDSLKYYIADDDMSILQIAEKVNGLHAPQIRTNSWAAISSTKIELVDYEKLRCLTDIEDGKEILKEKLKYLTTFGSNNIQDKTRESKEKLIFLLTDIISTENSIKRIIERFEKLNNQ